MQHDELGLRIVSNDLVDFEENIYLKKLTVENLRDEEREVRLFLSQDFQIYGNEIGDTAAYKPENSSLLHYKGEKYSLANIWANHKFGIIFMPRAIKEPGKTPKMVFSVAIRSPKERSIRLSRFHSSCSRTEKSFATIG